MSLLSGVTIKDLDIGKIFSGFGTLLKDIRTAITGKAPLDPTKQAELETKLVEMEMRAQEMEQALMLAQMRINEIEAANPRLFISGWRPATGWLCVTGLAWQVFVWPIWVWAAKLFNVPTPPNVDVAVLVTLLIGMLGLGTLRTVEKTKDVASK
jgi:hypothetical protein